jgi:general secretion pathway protein C
MLGALAALLAQAPDAAVVGVVLSRKPELSTAVVQAAGRTRVVGIGDSVSGARILEISGSGVTLEADGRRFELRLRGELDTPRAAAPPRGGLRDPGPPLAEPAADPNLRTLSRSEVDSRLRSEIPRILAETTLFPVTEDGRVVGFTLTRLAEGTLLTEVGLRPGDVLLRLNDVPIDSLATLISLWPRLQHAPQLRADVLRAGQPSTLMVNIK